MPDTILGNIPGEGKIKQWINEAITAANAELQQTLLATFTRRDPVTPVVGDGTFIGREWELTNGNITDNGRLVGSLTDANDVIHTISGIDDPVFPSYGDLPTNVGPATWFERVTVQAKDNRDADVTGVTFPMCKIKRFAVRTGVYYDTNTNKTYFYIHLGLTEDTESGMHWLKCFVNDDMTLKDYAYVSCFPVSKLTVDGQTFYAPTAGTPADVEMSPDSMHDTNKMPSNCKGIASEMVALGLVATVIWGRLYDNASAAFRGNISDLNGYQLTSAMGNQSGTVNEFFVPWNHALAGLKTGAVLTIADDSFYFGYEQNKVIGHIQLTSDAIEVSGSDYVKFTFKKYGTESDGLVIQNKYLHCACGNINGLTDAILDSNSNVAPNGVMTDKYPERYAPFKMFFVENPWGCMATWADLYCQISGVLREFSGRTGESYSDKSTWHVNGVALAANIGLGPFTLDANQYQFDSSGSKFPSFGAVPRPAGGSGLGSVSEWYNSSDVRAVIFGRSPTSTSAAGALSYGCGGGSVGATAPTTTRATPASAASVV